jgi:hypothetical protein
MEMSSQLHVPASLPPEKSLRYALNKSGFVGPTTGLEVLENIQSVKVVLIFQQDVTL